MKKLLLKSSPVKIESCNKCVISSDYIKPHMPDELYEKQYFCDLTKKEITISHTEGLIDIDCPLPNWKEEIIIMFCAECRNEIIFNIGHYPNFDLRKEHTCTCGAIHFITDINFLGWKEEN